METNEYMSDNTEVEEKKDKLYYPGLDALRVIACIGIVLAHVASNSSFNIDGWIYQRLIPSFTNFVYVFMVISAFGMCCGYCEKFLENKIDLIIFYKKRYMRILPFFSLMVVIDLLTDLRQDRIYEAIADITLVNGLIPNEIEVIGVGWFLGLVFVFFI